ncbi:hypothetical protein MF406_11185 [Georgenia sp. TF02-10]|uniref:hypothetical protein n=1 Tax=Georgenia sp. TF02-10 TaxID=2917725 RepID=UPI001FA6FB60|nr:hypothetical protein [Georgenia sp. TF02-10]UNX53551.1 hypothetical protein MF406_11185 [Georgenia sp. TF02-10]
MLPQIIAEVVSAEHVVLTVNGKRLPATPTRRAELGPAIAELIARFASPTRVEVRELDGSVYADILTPEPDGAAPLDESPERPRPELVEFTADGFVPGEDVAIALVLRHTSAAGNGTARALLDRAEHATATGELILLGRISGTTMVRRID